MRSILLLSISLIFYFTSFAGKIFGSVTDSEGNILSFSSIQVKGTSIGTTANSAGKYAINLKAGTYTIVCQHVGYQRLEKTITVANEEVELNFQLEVQQYLLNEVIVQKGEDPAYEIIRNAIKKRPVYQKELKSYSVDVYTKGQLKLRDHPKKILGKKVDFEDGDTSKNRMIYLSESIAKYSVDQPNKTKVEVVATKVSGQSDGFGLSAPQIVSFYNNNIMIGEGLNPRGFLSPISDNALHFYKFKYEGDFFEEGRQISRIKVIPKRKYEPLFHGYINIIEDQWRIHSLQLYLTKESQMQMIDTLRLEQLYVPVNDVWVMQNQVIYPAIKIFGFDTYGSFVNVYSNYNLDPKFEKDFFNNTVIKYTDSSNKKTETFWETARPIVLQEEEVKDYYKKDSIEQVRKDPKYLDSLDRARNKLSVSGLLVTGQTFSNQKKRSTIQIPSLFEMVNFNTAEGAVVDLAPTYFKKIDTTAMGRRSYSITPNFRYGFSNERFNANVSGRYSFGKKYNNSIFLSGGSDVFQFNNRNPIEERTNSISTLLYKRNLMKIYEAKFLRAAFSQGVGDGFSWTVGVNYQDRLPLENTTDVSWNDDKELDYTPNYPIELMNENLQPHQVLKGSFSIRWQPGTRYVEFPERKISIGSKYPVFTTTYTQAFKNIAGSDLDFSKWQFRISDELNFKLAGKFDYQIEVGGFLNKDSVTVPDYFHINGNELRVYQSSLSGFKMAPYYKFSHTNRFYTEAHAEHHFNGLFTNKIPLFRKLNWHLVGGASTLYINNNSYYAEVYGGLENILKVFRVDFVYAYAPGQKNQTGIRIGTNLR